MAQLLQSSVQNRLLSGLPPADFALLPLETVALPVKLVLVEPMMPIEHLYFIEKGLASITTTGTGKVEIGMVGREGLVGASPVVLGVDRSPYRYSVQMPGAALRIATGDLLEAIARSRSLHLLLNRGIQVLMTQIAQTAFSNAACTIEVRLARWLLMCRDRADDNALALTHESIAELLGVRRPGVSIAIQMLEGHRLVKAKRNLITILDRAGLEALANKSYGLAEAQHSELIEGRQAQLEIARPR